eukprot:5613704-Prymnesium_polylepis.1
MWLAEPGGVAWQGRADPPRECRVHRWEVVYFSGRRPRTLDPWTWAAFIGGVLCGAGSYTVYVCESALEDTQTFTP